MATGYANRSGRRFRRCLCAVEIPAWIETLLHTNSGLVPHTKNTRLFLGYPAVLRVFVCGMFRAVGFDFANETFRRHFFRFLFFFYLLDQMPERWVKN